MTWILNPQIFVGALWTMKIEGFGLCKHLWNFCVQRVKIPNPTIRKHVILYYRGEVGGGEGVGGLRIENGTLLWNHFHPLICCAIFSAALCPCQVLLGLLAYLAVVLVQGSLRKHPFLLALRRCERFAQRNVCDSVAEIPYWWRKSMFT